eukprot:scaffold13.g269.t1
MVLYKGCAAREAGSAAAGGRALGLLAALAGVAAGAAGFAASGVGVVAHAEAPVPPADKPNPYLLPSTGLKGLPKEVIVYQYEVCPFCCKVKAFLDYHKARGDRSSAPAIPYRVVEVNPLTKAELKWSEYKKVPVVVLDGEQVNDSSAIVSRLEAELEASGRAGRAASGVDASSSGGGGGGWFGRRRGGAAPPPAGASRQEEEMWRRWVDDWFVRVITVNIYRNAKEAWQTFDYIAEHGNFGWVQREAARVVGAGMMWVLSGRLKKKYGVQGDERDNLYRAANEWVDAVGPNRKFLGGDAPDLADLATFGVIRSVVGTPTFNDLMQHSRIGPWYERMFNAVGEAARRP